MAHFVEKNTSHITQFQDTFIKSICQAASAGPALANAAMIVAQGCPKRYTEALSALYTANNLLCPDFTVLFDQQMMPETPEAEYSSVPEVTQDSDDGVQSILRHIEDVEELSASMTEVLDILTDFDTFEDSTTCQSVPNDSLLKINDHQINNTIQSINNDSLLQVDHQRISFNSNYYTISTMSNAHVLSTYHDIEDWFDEDLSVHDLSYSLEADDSINSGTSPFAFTAPDLPSLGLSPMLSPIAKQKMSSFSTPTRSSHHLKRFTPLSNSI